MDTYLVVAALGPASAGLLEQIAHTVRESGCSIGDSRMAALGREFAAIMLISGHWNAVAKLEQALPRLAERLGVEIRVRRTERRDDAAGLIPYAVEVVGADRAGIVDDIAGFFAQRDIGVEDLYTARYPAPHTGAALFSLHMTVAIPASTSLATVRGEFMDFCDDLNLDAMLAPVK